MKQAARRAGMHLTVLADYCILPTAETAHTLVINFASIAPEQIGTAMRILEDSHGGADLLGHSVLRGPRRGCRPTRAFSPPEKPNSLRYNRAYAKRRDTILETPTK